jgi:hypothetical protein
MRGCLRATRRRTAQNSICTGTHKLCIHAEKANRDGLVKSQWRSSSRQMSSLEKQRPGNSSRCLSQKMAQKATEKMLSTAANAMRRLLKMGTCFIRGEPIEPFG